MLTKDSIQAERYPRISGEGITYAFEAIFNRYQHYVQESLRLAVADYGQFRTVPAERFSPIARALARGRFSSKGARIGRLIPSAAKFFDSSCRTVFGNPKTPSNLFHPAVGQYLISRDGNAPLKLCVDTHDSRHISSPELLEWSDCYLKSNYWPTSIYPEKVRPIINPNPFVLDHLETLSSLRHSEKEYDLIAAVRVWGGSNEVEGIEHNVRILEQLAKANVKSFLWAYLVAGDIPKLEKRLSSVGVHCSTSPLPIKKLWELSAKSRLNFIRLGMHYCTPWRLIDMFAMGSAVLLDQSPKTVWSTPLEEGKHFLQLGLECMGDRHVSTDEAYNDVPRKVEHILSNIDCSELGANTSAYFDAEIHPLKLGERILRICYPNIEFDREVESSVLPRVVNAT
jgi:hypothetical protein